MDQEPRSRWARIVGRGSRSETAWSVIVAIACLGPLIAYALPEEPLSQWPGMAAFVDVVAQWIPAIDRLSELSATPEVTRTFMSLEWAVFGPLCVVLFLRFGRPTEHSMITAMRVTQARWWYFVLGPLAMAVLAWFLWALPFVTTARPDALFRLMVNAMGHSRFWLGLFGSVFVMVAAFSVVAFFKSFSLIRLAYSVRASSPPS